jgi:hypothetical protein
MTVAPIGLVSALRETSVVFAAFIAHLFLRERLTKSRLGALRRHCLWRRVAWRLGSNCAFQVSPLICRKRRPDSVFAAITPGKPQERATATGGRRSRCEKISDFPRFSGFERD